jgi:hypothetical protein
MSKQLARLRLVNRPLAMIAVSNVTVPAVVVAPTMTAAA